jgi:lipopolysaccharide export LptBFGC system permease protein LptF
MRKLEYEWREEVTRRYGLLPLLTGGGVLWTLVVALSGWAWAARRKRARAKLAEWATEDELQRQAAVTRQAAALGTLATHEEIRSGDAAAPSSATRGARIIEHEGRYYTLH